MKASNFRLTERIPANGGGHNLRALVDFESGLFFKKRESLELYKPFGGAWYFAESGGSIGPVFIHAIKAYEANKGQHIGDIEIENKANL